MSRLWKVVLFLMFFLFILSIAILYIMFLLMHCVGLNQERDQRYKELGFRDKITLTSGRFLLGNKYVYCLSSE